MVTTFREFTPREFEQSKVDAINASTGNRHKEDGFHCPECNNKGYVAKLEEYDGAFRRVIYNCKCMDIRLTILRMHQSGLQSILEDYTFEKFEVCEPWQQTMKDAAVAYAKNPKGWFFLGGQSGSGKTHLCTAICRQFLLAGKKVQYMLWRDDITKIKRAVNDSEEYSKQINQFKTADVLYIDDLFKVGKTVEHDVPRPTSADINVAFEIVNYRYNNPSLLTIISTELTMDELLTIDQAIGSRICHRAISYTIAKDRERNFRLKNAKRI